MARSRIATIAIRFIATMAVVLILLAGVAWHTLRRLMPQPDPSPVQAIAVDTQHPHTLLGFAGELGKEGLPFPWRLFKNPLVPGGITRASSEPDVDGQWALRVQTERGSFGVERTMTLDPAIHWELAWDWKATRLPPHGDVRDAARDNSAIQVGLYFDAQGPGANPYAIMPKGKTLIYIWDTSADVDTLATRSFGIGSLSYTYKVLVLRSGEPASSDWLHERRDIRADFVRAYGEEPPPLRGIRVQSNSHRTGGSSEGLVRRITLSALPAE